MVQGNYLLEKQRWEQRTRHHCQVSSIQVLYIFSNLFQQSFFHGHVVHSRLCQPCSLQCTRQPNPQRALQTALRTAVVTGNEIEVARLLQHSRWRCRVSTPGPRGWTALMQAALFGREAIVVQLLPHLRGQTRDVNQQGMTALMLAAVKGNAWVLRGNS